MLKIAAIDLENSGISVEEGEAAEMYSVKDASTVYPEFKAAPALIIPYVNPFTDDFFEFTHKGKTVPFCRVRYYIEEPKAQGFKKKKVLRYSQPEQSGVHPYFPVVEGIDWPAIAKDPDVPIMITEGEKKALAACLAEVPTIGLGGVYNFTHDGELLPVLEDIEWNGRTVYICYDSDAKENKKIQIAESRLSTELSLKRKANVFLVRLPSLPNGDKMGVDDFLVKNGEDALFDLLEDAPQMRGIDREILKLNNDVIWVAKDGLLLDLTTDTWMKKTDFVKGSDYSSLTLEVMNSKGDGAKIISIPDAWLTHPLARRYADTVFIPDTDDKSVELPNGGYAYNRFRGISGYAGDVNPFFDLYDWLMSRTDEFDPDLIWKLICYKIQNLGARIDLGLMLLGAQGSGKSLFGKIVAEMVQPYDKIMSSNELGSDFNGWIETSLIVVMNEAKTYQLKYNMDKLRTYITDKRQPMNEKYRINRQVDNHAFFIFNSNERSAGAFPDDDRRMIILGCPGIHPKGDAFYDPIGEWYEKDGPKKLLHYFQNYDLEGWVPPNRAPETREKRMAYNSSLTPIQKLGNEIVKGKSNLIVMWIAAALEWAGSEQVGSAPHQVSLSMQIAQSLTNIQIRPFYTPDELAMMFPAISATLAMGKVKDAAPAGMMAQELLQTGVNYLKCEENFDGFYYKGQCRQFLIVSDHAEYDKPITQDHFDELMAGFPTYREYRAKNRKPKTGRRERKRRSAA